MAAYTLLHLKEGLRSCVSHNMAEENSAGETNSDPIIIENDWVSTEIKPVTDYYIGYVTYMQCSPRIF